MSPPDSRRAAVLVLLCMSCAAVTADERRAAAPDFKKSNLSSIFFDDLSHAIRGERPRIAPPHRQPTGAAKKASSKPDQPTTSATSNQRWENLISAESLEEEVKGTRLHFDSVVTTPGAFNSGGFQEARVDLSILAVLFAVIHDYNGEVRWKADAAAARDLIARTAFNCKAGSTQVYNEAKLRKHDLQDLISGSGLANPSSDPNNDWSAVVDRSPMMKYAERLRDSLKSAATSPDSIRDNADQIRREVELLAMIGMVLGQAGMDEADDEDYKSLCIQMTKSATTVSEALQAGELDAVGVGIGAITKSCDACHEQYR